MNYTWIAGHLGTDPETRFTPSGKKVTSMSVACKSRKNGKEETVWWRITIWGESFDKILPYFKKGSPIVCCGEMRPPEIYQNREGNSQVSLNLVANHISFSPFGKSKSGEESGGGFNQTASVSAPTGSFQGNTPSQENVNSEGVSDDEIPF